MKSETNELIKTASTQWNFIWWILGTIFIPITIPYTIFQILGNILEKKNKNGLQGKVRKKKIDLIQFILFIKIKLFV